MTQTKTPSREPSQNDLLEWYRAAREYTYNAFTPHEGGTVGFVIDWGIMLLIAINISAVMLETVESLAAQHTQFFLLIEIVSVAVFTTEYIGRIWSAVQNPDYEGMISGRLDFAARPLVIVDLLAILPFYIASMIGIGDLRVLRVLRLFRVLRLLKITRYSESLLAFVEVLHRKKTDLAIAGIANLSILIIASSVMYYIEHSVQPEAFSSIPATLWWGAVTLTTVGYGNISPITPLGKFVGALIAVLGIGLFALPASILASGFIEVASDKTYECPHCDEDIDAEALE